MEPYIGEIRAFAGNFAPEGWANCDGSLLSIAENDVLFTLIGTTYGGDGQSTFALPDLRGRAIVSQGRSVAGTTYPIGGAGGAEKVTIGLNEVPGHTHAFNVSTEAATATGPANNFLAAPVDPSPTPQTIKFYVAPTAAPASYTVRALAAGSITPTTGTSQPHENRGPYVTITYIIATMGIYPSAY